MDVDDRAYLVGGRSGGGNTARLRAAEQRRQDLDLALEHCLELVDRAALTSRELKTRTRDMLDVEMELEEVRERLRVITDTVRAERAARAVLWPAA